jgi:hypothetical protein
MTRHLTVCARCDNQVKTSRFSGLNFSALSVVATFGGLGDTAIRTWFSVASLSLFFSAARLAQNSSLNGTVTDPTGAEIPKASITLTNQQNGRERTIASDAPIGSPPKPPDSPKSF